MIPHSQNDCRLLFDYALLSCDCVTEVQHEALGYPAPV